MFRLMVAKQISSVARRAARRVFIARRKWRIASAIRKITTWPGMRVIDIGCGVDGRSFSDFVDPTWKITGIDRVEARHQHPGFSFQLGDARDLKPHADNSFDLAVSVGMLEHITDDDDFAAVVSEMRRVSRQHIIIVPWRAAWIEPHYAWPGFGLLPERAQIALARMFNLAGHREILSRDPGYLRRSTRWLSRRAYGRAFPDSEIYFAPTLDTLAIIRKV